MRIVSVVHEPLKNFYLSEINLLSSFRRNVKFNSIFKK